jgi:peptidoglycan/xylan/chitin deacetylase (PgdA/CDA1 family)
MAHFGPELLQFLSRWDREPEALSRALEAVAGHPVAFDPHRSVSGRSVFHGFDQDPLAAVTQLDDGTWLLPHDPWTAWRSAVEERYLGPIKPPMHARVSLPYHVVPGALRMALYPFVAGRNKLDPEASPPDPAWPIEPRIDRYRMQLYEGLGAPKTERGPWPGGKAYPLLVTLDVDTKHGMKLAGSILDELVELGVKPCFFLVGLGYEWDRGFCEAVRQAGGEIGLHGDLHDNRIAFLTAQEAGERLDRCRDLVHEHRILGFRSPSLLTSDALYEALGTRFAWDSSVPDTDTHTLIGPRRGCGTIFPYRRDKTVVLPTTMPADDRLELLGYRGLNLLNPWRRKWAHVRELGGLCHFLLHPEPHLFGRPLVRDLFGALIKEILAANDAWIATPSEVAEYWRSLEDQGDRADTRAFLPIDMDL